MNEHDIRQCYEFMGHSPLEVSVIAPAQFKGDKNEGVKVCSLVKSADSLLELCSRWDGSANIYVGLNELTEEYQSKRGNRTNKTDIAAVHFIPIDVDPVKPAEMKYQAATDDELECALEAGKAVAEWFTKQGFKPPGMAMSGNGCQLWCRIPRYVLANEPTNGQRNWRYYWELRLKAFYDDIRSAIPTELSDKIKVDAIQDVTRILKVIGTTSTKGNTIDYPNRPRRVSRWIRPPAIGEVDSKLRDYVTSLPITAKQQTKTRTAKQKPTRPRTGPVTLPKLNDEQRQRLDGALKAPYVQLARQRLKRSDYSASDWAYLKELAKEGITDPDTLTWVLMTTEEGKHKVKDRNNYVPDTIDNFMDALGTSLTEGRQLLTQAFDSINVNSGRTILCNADLGLGKTWNAKRKVIEAVEKGINVLIIVPTHALASEWEVMELPDELKQVYEEHSITPICHLYGITHETVNCPQRERGMRLMAMGHAKLFRMNYCGSCNKRNECLHKQSIEQAKDAPILIAQHEHAHIQQGFFSLKSLGNDERRFIVIDEQAQFVHAVRLRRKDLSGNMALYRAIATKKSQTYGDIWHWDFLADRLEAMLNTIEQRHDYSLPNNFTAIPSDQTNELDAEIATYYKELERMPKVKNLLWDLQYILERKPTLQYDQDNDCLLYRWRPDWGNRTALILSGTTSKEYIDAQLKKPIDTTIANEWGIHRGNLKVVQLIVGMGGRNRLLKQCDSKTFTAQHGKLFKLILFKHARQRIALITSLGTDAPGDSSAKQRILQALSPIAQQHSKQVVNVTTEMLRKMDIPDGINEIPLFHYGMKGIDSLNGRFEVVWAINGHYYHPTAVGQAVYDKFDIDISGIDPERTPTELITFDKIFENKPRKFDRTSKVPAFTTQRYTYNNPVVELELRHTQIADMTQTEGRFLREENIHKVIYRTHNVNIPPYPGRVYTSWEGLFRYEFAPFVPPEAWIEGKLAQVWRWIQESNSEFTTNDIAEAVNVQRRDVKKRYLDPLIISVLIETVQEGGTGQGDSTVYKRSNSAQT